MEISQKNAHQPDGLPGGEGNAFKVFRLGDEMKFSFWRLHTNFVIAIKLQMINFLKKSKKNIPHHQRVPQHQGRIRRRREKRACLILCDYFGMNYYYYQGFLFE